MVIQNNFFVEKLLPMAIQRELSEEEMDEYRRPFKEPGESRRPTLTWPREIPIMGEGPEENVKMAAAYYEWLCTSADLPKLYIDAEPGFFASSIRPVVATWPNLQVVKSAGLHFLQEDSPDNIGKAIRQFLQEKVL